MCKWNNKYYANTHKLIVSFHSGFNEAFTVFVFFFTLSESGMSFNFTYGSESPFGSIGIRFLPWITAIMLKNSYALRSERVFCRIVIKTATQKRSVYLRQDTTVMYTQMHTCRPPTFLSNTCVNKMWIHVWTHTHE